MPRIYYECRDIEQPSGGVRRLYRHVEILTKNGLDAAILHHQRGFKVNWFTSPAPVTYSMTDLRVGPEDVLVIPEGHTDVMVGTALLPCRRVVIALNWANIYACLPTGLDWRHLGISDVIAGSRYEAEFIRRSMGLDSAIIVSGTNGELFKPAARKRCQIAYMPRKNAQVFHLIASVFRSRFPEYSDVPFVPIDSVTHEGVANALAESACFLSTSFPEGLARPPLEAMACGCVVVGFAGRGSLEYMHDGRNCYLVDDWDVLRAAECLGEAIRAFHSGAAAPMQEAARETALQYNLAREERTVLEYWTRFLARPSHAKPLCAVVLGEADGSAAAAGPIQELGVGLYDQVVASAPNHGMFIEVGTPTDASAYLASRLRAASKDVQVVVVRNLQNGGGADGLGAQFEAFCRRLRSIGVADRVTPIIGDSALSARRFADHSVDFVNIDSTHGFERARRDILAWLPKVKPGGSIGGVGLGAGHPDLVRAVADLFPGHSVEPGLQSWAVHKVMEGADAKALATRAS